MQPDVELPLVAFVDDDAGYLAWVARNPGGFVVNTTRSPHRDYLMLHRASCRHISGARRSRWTHQYVKVCGPSAALLERWAATELAGEAVRCGLCQP
ncbi:MAG TPA: hypothetical protein VMU75_00055 [Acidimicrobiales bacterium]|nr:hypothetical protein [Acidimicrobiales bacterium]